MLIRLMKPDFIFNDERGSLCQLVHEGWRQVNVVTSEKGAYRGGHCHMKNTEAFYVVEGSVRVSAEKDGESQTTEFSKGDMFALDAAVYHDFLYLEKTVLIGLYDNGVEQPDGTKDIVAK